MNFVNAIHIFFSGPLLIYVGLVKPNYTYLYKFLLVLGLIVACVFVWKLLTFPLSQRYVWFLIHILLFSSLLIYVGIKELDAPHVAFSLILAIGIGAFGYHLIRALT